MIHLGVLANPQTQQNEKNIELAKEEIDLIAMLEAKTKGNLTENEAKVIEQVLFELRMRFVEVSK